jgi:hypothetical protein
MMQRALPNKRMADAFGLVVPSIKHKQTSTARHAD